MVKRLIGIILLLLFLLPLLGCQSAGDRKTVLYIPLDNRPMNYGQVLELAEAGGIDVMVPPGALAGKGKEPAEVDRLWRWLEDNYRQADACVISTDMLLYGGLAPSRSHNREIQDVTSDIDRLEKLLAGGDKPVYAFSTVMRSAASSDSFEQPGYFQQYGNRILWLSQLADRIAVGETTPEQKEKYENIKKAVPGEILDDYLNRRDANLAVLKKMIELTEKGYIDYLVLGRDDCTPYGFHRGDMRALAPYMNRQVLNDKIIDYPGADELGAVLLARAINDLYDKKPSVYIHWATSKGPGITALYEDVSLLENVRWHIISAGAEVVDNHTGADLVLAINSPADKVIQASNQPQTGLPNNYHIELADKIAQWLHAGKPVAVADVAYANGSDLALMDALAGKNLLSGLAGYAGCNTAGNTIGMALAQGIIGINSVGEEKMYNNDRRYLLTRLVEDWGYQSLVRPAVQSRHEIAGAGQAIDSSQKTALEQEISRELNNFAQTKLNNQFGETVKVSSVSLPWNRLFEIDFEVFRRGNQL